MVETANGTRYILVDNVFDPSTRSFSREPRIITVNAKSGLIVSVASVKEQDMESMLASVTSITMDLRHQTVLPGFVDAHVHLFLHPYSETPWTQQLTQESLVERTIRATQHARETILAGYTTVRDLGTEGAADADVALRKCLSRPTALIPGPRYLIATRALVTTGSYGPKGNLCVNTEGVEGVTGAEAADGVDACIQATRRQIGAGADWIKFYADYKVRSRHAGVAASSARANLRTFNDAEIKAIVDTAHALGVKVAAHAQSRAGVLAALRGGVDSIEHGLEVDEEVLAGFRKTRAVWVPTLAVFEALAQGRPELEMIKKAFKLLLSDAGKDVRLATGGDTGTFTHGDNALEMKMMVRWGASPTDVLYWATMGAWECVRGASWEGESGTERIKRISELQETVDRVGENDMPFGILRQGFAADIIASSGDFEADFDKAVSKESITFVMKGGKLYKQDGRAVV